MSAYLNGSEVSLKYAGFGKDGVSPIVNICEIEGGHRVDITDEDKTSSFDVMNGKDGENGEDGISPTVNVESIEGGHRVNITDAEKTSSFDVMNGKDGKGDIDEVKSLFANALKGSASGEMIYVDDISPLTHELSVKLSSESVTDFSKVRLRVFKTKGKNLFDVSKIVTTASLKDPNEVQLVNNNDGSLTVSAYGISSIIRYDDGTWRYVTLREIAPLLEVGKSYYMSAKTNGKKFITLCCYDETLPENDYIRCIANWFFDVRGLVVNNINNHPITDELLDCGVFFYNDFHNGVDEAKISDIQIELITNEEHIEKNGYAPTDYELYQNDFAEYSVNTDGTVEGVISTPPTMYLETDMKDVNISVVYNRDLNDAVTKIYADVDTKLKEKVSKDYVNNNFVGRLKGNITGIDAVSITDVAKPEHDMSVKVRFTATNEFIFPDADETIIERNGITIVIKHGIITLNGVCTESFDHGFGRPSDITLKKSTSYYFTATPERSENSGTYVSFVYESMDSTGMWYFDEVIDLNGKWQGFTTGDYEQINGTSLYVYIEEGDSFEDFVINPVITEGSEKLDITKIRLTRCGKNAFDVSKVKKPDIINNNDGSLTFSRYGVIAGTLKDIAPMLQVGKIYRLSMKTDGKKFIVIGGYTWYTDSRGLSKGSDTNLPITEDLLSERVFFYNNGGSSTCTVSDIQMELNDAEVPADFVPTEYEAFNHNIKEYIPNADGTVEGVRSLYPTTVIYSDKVGVEITADYNIDINSIKINNVPINKPTTLAGYGITDAYTKIQVDAKITESETAMSTLMDEKIAEIPTASVRKFKVLLNADGWFSESAEDGSTPDDLFEYFDIPHVKFEDLNITYIDVGCDNVKAEYVYGGHPERAVFVKLASSYEGIPTTHEQRRAYDEIKLHTIVKSYSGLNDNNEQEYGYYLGIGIMGDTKPTVDIPIEVIIV